MFSIYQFAVFGFIMGLTGVILGLAYVGVGFSNRKREADNERMANELKEHAATYTLMDSQDNPLYPDSSSAGV